MNLRELTDGVLEHFNHGTDGNTPARDRIVRYLNEWHRRILTKPGMDRLRQSVITVASTASSPTVLLPPSINKILRIRETTNDITLEQRLFDWYRFAEPDPTSHTGTPTVWVPMGEAAAITPSSSGTAVWVESTSASDTSRCYIEGVRLGGYVWSDTITLTGVTRVQIGSLPDWIELTKITLDSPAVGVVSIGQGDGASDVIATIPSGKTESRYRRIALWPTPSASITYSVDYQRQLLDMVNDTDTPLVPEDFCWLLQTGAKVSEYERTSDARVAVARMDVERGIGELRASMHSREVIVPGRFGVQVISRINGWCPADTVVR